MMIGLQYYSLQQLQLHDISR